MIGVVQWSDLHAPHINKPAVAAILEFSKKWKPQYHVILGDALNLSGISRHVQEDYIEQYEDKVQSGLVVFGQLIDRIAKTNPKSEIVWIWGNHDERLRAFVRKNPSWRDILDDPIGLLESFGRCKHARRIRLVQYADPEEDFHIGPMAFIHGFYTGKHCASQHVDAYGMSVTCGHTHTMQMFTAVRKGDPIAGYTVGHLMSKEGRRWLKGRPHRWVVGFAYMEYDQEANIYTQHPIPIVNGRFCFAGKIYDGSHDDAQVKKGRQGRRGAPAKQSRSVRDMGATHDPDVRNKRTASSR